jgi:hypothetical protein
MGINLVVVIGVSLLTPRPADAAIAVGLAPAARPARELDPASGGGGAGGA